MRRQARSALRSRSSSLRDNVGDTGSDWGSYWEDILPPCEAVRKESDYHDAGADGSRADGRFEDGGEAEDFSEEEIVESMEGSQRDGWSHVAREERGCFKFLSIFKFETRKGWDVLLQAYWQEFAPHEKVRCVYVPHTPNISPSSWP